MRRIWIAKKWQKSYNNRVIIAPNIASIVAYNPAVEAGSQAVLHDLSAQAEQVTDAIPYYRMENNNQPKQGAGEKRASQGAVAKEPSAALDEELDEISFHDSSLYMAQVYAQGELPAAPVARQKIDWNITAFDAMQFASYLQTARSGAGSPPRTDAVI